MEDASTFVTKRREHRSALVGRDTNYFLMERAVVVSQLTKYYLLGNIRRAWIHPITPKPHPDIKVKTCGILIADVHYYIIYTQLLIFVDINECELNTDGCSDYCVNQEGSFICTCALGYRLDADSKTCIGKNHC